MLTRLHTCLFQLPGLRHIVVAAITLFIGIVLPQQLPASNLSEQLPDIGDAGMSTLSPAEEAQLGREFMRNAKASLKILDDPLANLYMQSLADNLVSQYKYHDQTIRIFIVNDPSINAFAGPGGYIGVHTGLIMTANTEAELASVMSHEIAHVVQRHLVRRFEANSKLGLPTMGAMIAAIVLGSSNPQASQALFSSAVAGNIQQQLSYSRENEQEADRIGLELLAGANFDPKAMPVFFEELQKKQRIGESSAPEYFRTHPLTSSRIADTRNRSELYPTGSYANNINFQLVKARIASFAPQSPAQSSFVQNVASGAVQSAVRDYFQVVMALETDDKPLARKLITSLRESDRHSVIFPYTAAEIELADNQPEKSLEILDAALKLFPGNLPLTEIYARTHLQLSHPQVAFNALKAILPRTDGQEWIYKLYAKAASDAGQQGEGYRALAELSYSLGDTHQAVDYFEQALKIDTISEFERLSYRARLDTLKSEIKSTTGTKNNK